MTQQSSTDEQRYNEEKNYRERQIRLGKILNWITGGSVVIAAFALYVIYLQADSARVAAEATKDQASSAKTAAEIAKQGFDESVKTFRLEQRAWILPKDNRMRTFQDTLHLEFQVANSGKVPASIIGAKYAFSDSRLPQCPAVQEELPPYGVAIPPNGEIWLGLALKGEMRERVKQSESVYV
jgi:hypothetical protein